MSCNLIVYPYRPAGAIKQQRFAVATGDRPQDIVSTHGTQKTAIRRAEKLAAKRGCSVKVER